MKKQLNFYIQFFYIMRLTYGAECVILQICNIALAYYERRLNYAQVCKH